MATEDGKGGRLVADWIANIGEQPYHIVTHFNKYHHHQDIIVSCESTIFILTEQGEIRYQRRFDFTPSCLKAYHLPRESADVYNDEGNRTFKEDIKEQKLVSTPCFMMLVGSFNNFVMVYNDVRLVWTARTQLPPVFIDTATFHDTPGLIVTMSDSGFLQVSYLGTE